MVKVKNKKNFGAAEKVHAKRNKEKFKSKLNPFEVHVNRQKFTILGKKNKNERGLPGVSRGKAIKKRQNTLGHELKLVDKSNTFLDKRIGEKNFAISEEEKMIARFTAEKLQQHKVKANKKSIYNLAEDEILTHRGQTLEEIEKFDDPRSDDDDDDDEEFGFKKSGGLQGSFVSDANFGGGVLSRSANSDGVKSRKDLIEQLIIESKKRKMEKQKMKEETLDLTQKLDSEWKDLHVLVSKEFNKEIEDKKEKPSLIDKLLSDHNKKNEEYDKTMRELKFEPRGTPSDRLKSEDEIAKIEKDKLEKLEQERMARMKGTFETKSAPQRPKHKSADDLDDGFELEDVSDFMIAYDKEGKLIVPLDKIKNKVADENEEESESEEEDDNEEEEEEDEEEESGSESDDSLDDLREADAASSDEEESDKKTKPDKPNLKRKLSNGDTNVSKVVENGKDSAENEDAAEKIKQDLLSRKLMMEKASKELPYTFEMPGGYEDLSELLQNQSAERQNVIIERIIKCNHPSLGEGNKEKLGHLFAYLLQHINDLFSNECIEDENDLRNAFKCFDNLVGHMYTLALMDPLNAKCCIMEVIKEKYEEHKRNTRRMPGMDTLIFFKLVSVLFPTSDLRHPAVTPCALFMTSILTLCRFRNCADVSRGLFLVMLVLEFTSLSKRIMPAAVNFIRGILSLCVPLNFKRRISVISPFKNLSSFSNMLVLNQDYSKRKVSADVKMPLSYLIEEDLGEEFKIHITITALKMFEAVFNQCKEFYCQNALFEHHIRMIEILSKLKYPPDVLSLMNNILSDVSKSLEYKSIAPLVEEKMPKMIKMYEPAFDANFTGKTKRIMSKEKAEHQKLLYKHKKEMKSALREIRRDKSFISSVKIKQKLRSDELRKQKVKQIYSEATSQQGELNALQRSKKRKK